ncbi:MAG: hypothetical protein ACRC0R_05240 [Cetobacterium sp.]
MKRNLLIVDLSNLLYKYLYVYGNLSIRVKMGDSIINKPTGHLYGSINMLNSVARANIDTDIIVAVDGKSPRKIISDEYKDRTEYDTNFSVGAENSGRYNVHKDSHLVIKLLSIVPNISFLYDPQKEADDIIHSYIKDNRYKYDKIGILSEDRDLLISIIDENTFQFNKIKPFHPLWDNMSEHDYWDIEKVKNNYFNLFGNQIIIYKGMIGDSSDNIKGYYRFQKKVAGIIATGMKFLNDEDTTLEYDYSTELNDNYSLYTIIGEDGIDNLINEFSTTRKNFDKYLDIMLEDIELFKKNINLVRPYYSKVVSFKTDLNKESLKALALKYKLKTYIQNVINGDLYE